jgi:hypothetical protein
MEVADSVLLGGGTAKQEFYFSIPLLNVYSAHHGVEASLREGATPHIDALPVTAGGALEVSVVQGIDERGGMRTEEALGAIDHQL